MQTGNMVQILALVCPSITRFSGADTVPVFAPVLVFNSSAAPDAAKFQIVMLLSIWPGVIMHTGATGCGMDKKL